MIWPRKEFRKGYKIEMMWMFWEDKEDVPVWCLSIVLKVECKNDKEIKVDVRWEDWRVSKGGLKESKVKLEKNKRNPDKPKSGTWREYLRSKLLDITKFTID